MIIHFTLSPAQGPKAVLTCLRDVVHGAAVHIDGPYIVGFLGKRRR